MIYYYHNERLPLFLLSAYSKSQKANLSQSERNVMKGLIPLLLAGYVSKR
ncbi:MAG: Toxin-antitoxin system, toxin component, RelE family [Candidatus Solibacter sp.]|nr:Toxin-antitoxin system, toxin component, RelE family [Candidatus Solibacter sp.]